MTCEYMQINQMFTDQCIALVYSTLEYSSLRADKKQKKKKNLLHIYFQHLFKMLKDETTDSQNLHTSANVLVSILEIGCSL